MDERAEKVVRWLQSRIDHNIEYGNSERAAAFIEARNCVKYHFEDDNQEEGES